MNKKSKRKDKLIAYKFDPLGSYTGVYLIGEIGEPDQDADDL